jgi:hypothetical protein
MRNAFAPIVRARPVPTFGRPVHLRGRPHRLRPGTSPQALRIPPRDGHPALRSFSRAGSRSPLAVSRFPLRARLELSIPVSHFGQRGITPASWIRRSSSERQRDFNPPDQCAARRTLCPLLTSATRSGDLAVSSVHQWTRRRSPEVSLTTFTAHPPDLQPGPLMGMDFVTFCSLVRSKLPPIRFLFVGSRLCSTLPSDPTSR